MGYRLLLIFLMWNYFLEKVRTDIKSLLVIWKCNLSEEVSFGLDYVGIYVWIYYLELTNHTD